jgi:putative membrane protein
MNSPQPSPSGPLGSAPALLPTNNKLWSRIIWALAVAIPVVVALLILMPKGGQLADLDFTFLPRLNAVLNSGTALALVIGYVLIRRRQIAAHRAAMLTAFTLSSLFLISYVIYHFAAEHTVFGDLNHDGLADAAEKAQAGTSRLVYVILLLTHIVLAATVVPFALFSVYFGLTRQDARHKRLSRYTFPIWLYVAVTGVIVYLMISPYYR